jgi:transcriptional regulator with XRE-family HTH domain
MQDVQKWVGDRIRSIRLSKRLSQEALGHAAGVNRSHMGKIERGEVNLGIKTLLAITAKLEINLSTFFKSFPN